MLRRGERQRSCPRLLRRCLDRELPAASLNGFSSEIASPESRAASSPAQSIIIEKVLQQLFAVFRENRFGVKLNALDRELLVPDRHDHSVTRLRADRQFSRQGFGIDHQGMVAHGGKRVFDVLENRQRIVTYLRAFAVHDRRRPHHCSTVGGAYGLVTEANSQDWNPRAELLYGIAGNASFLRCAGTGG